MIKTLLTAVLLLLIAGSLRAQDFAFGQISAEDLNMTKYGSDTSAHALVLQEFGRSRINVGNDDKLKVFYDYHVKIKIFDAEGFDKGTVKIPVYSNSDNDGYEDVYDIKGVTHYSDDHGNIQKKLLPDDKIYPQKQDKHLAYYNFALPGIKKGCVIEYSYTSESPYWWDFPSWSFQDDIPKIYSEYEVHIPAFWVFNASLKGSLKLTKSTAELESKCFSSGGASADCSLLVYGMKNIPAFVEEDYMTSKKNFLSAVNFELSDFTNPWTGGNIKYTKEWKDIDYSLKTDDNFGGQLKKKGLFKDRLVPVLAGKTDSLDKAKAIYTYIQKTFKWNNNYGIYSSDGISKALDSHSGSSGDINLSLVTALNAAGIHSQAVLLSTRDNGLINSLYPVISDFDYVVAKTNIGGKTYLLDATDPLLPFGTLPYRCLNDKGRVFSLDNPSYWIDLDLPQRERNTFNLDLTLQDDGKLKGTITHYSLGFEAYKKRVAIKKFNSVDEYVEDLGSNMPKMKILKADISNLDSLDLPISETYQVEINLYDKLNADKLAFNPYFLDKIDANPFKLKDRSYPVDWGMPSEDTFILTLHLPARYTVQSAPQAVSTTLPNKGGVFITNYQADDNTYTFSNAIKFYKSVYSSAEYPYLKALYNDIIKVEKAEIILVKKQ